ncbi:MAG TPA: PQQ-dependent sugar dehydrogenase [Gammaproteobacteria bacterium]|nr:PQQ-dependent sugar dehydrogenase [Gammaproteobacteria bacterium]
MPNKRFSLAVAAVVLAASALVPTFVAAQAPDWKNDAPGRAHRIDVAALPAPGASSADFPRIVPKPADAKLQLPPGFKIDVFTRDVTGPRTMRVAPNGDIFLAETKAGRIKVLRASADGASVASSATYADGLTGPFGMQFYPSGGQPQWLYVTEVNRVLRYAYKVGDTKASGQAEVVVPQLASSTTGHSTRDLVFSLDGKRMFVAVGSQSNVAEGMPKKTPQEIKAWEAEHGVGAAWGDETNRADVFVFDVGSGKPGKPFATGIRNCVAIAMQSTGDLWCTTNERDALGDNLVPDYSTRVKEGGYYGWPWYYMGDREDPRHAGERPDLKSKTIIPDVPYQAHSAAVGFTFYTASTGRSAFPAEYVGDAFAVFHGSWNRSSRTGHKVVRVPMKNGAPTGEYSDFLVGFITEDGKPWARPSSITELPDGSLLLSDDDGNLIYRISYSR